jgi:hypothetical protein
MAFVELTRILPEAKKVKCSLNASNIVYFQAPLEGDAGSGCTLTDITGRDIAVVESYPEVAAKFRDA